MARIRTIKPEARKSFTLASWPREVRLAWHYLSMYLDDKGRGVDDVRLIVAECFPLDRDDSELTCARRMRDALADDQGDKERRAS